MAGETIRLPGDHDAGTSCSRSSSSSTRMPRCTASSCRCRCRSRSTRTPSSATSDPTKDVDGFHPVNVGKLLIGHTDGFVPCTPAGVQQHARATTAWRRAARSASSSGAAPSSASRWPRCMVQAGAGADATVTVCHSRTRDLAAHTRRADILIVAAGRARMVTADMVKPGAVVIDVGMNRIADASREERHPARRRRGLRRRARGRVAHHAGARRRRPDDDRDAARATPCAPRSARWRRDPPPRAGRAPARAGRRRRRCSTATRPVARGVSRMPATPIRARARRSAHRRVARSRRR